MSGSTWERKICNAPIALAVLILRNRQEQNTYHSKGSSLKVDKHGLFEKIVGDDELNEKILDSLILVDNI